MLLVGCGDAPTKSKLITLNVTRWQVGQETMRAPILDDENGKPLTDLYVYDGTRVLAHQQSTDSAFGEVQLQMDYGTHALSVVATRSEGQQIEDGVLKVSALRPTFGKLMSITVSDVSDAFEVELKRLTGQLCVTIEDEIPADAATLRIQISNKYDDMEMMTFRTVNPYAYTNDIPMFSWTGQKSMDFVVIVHGLSPQSPCTSDVRLTVLRADGSVLSDHLIKDVPLASNTRTRLHGELFAGNALSVTVDHTWEEDLLPEW